MKLKKIFPNALFNIYSPFKTYNYGWINKLQYGKKLSRRLYKPKIKLIIFNI